MKMEVHEVERRADKQENEKSEQYKKVKGSNVKAVRG